VFRVEDFGGRWINAPPDPEWEIPFTASQMSRPSVRDHSMPVV
jgi:hypothetical protein